MHIAGELLALAQQGDPVALGRLLIDVQPDLRRYARRQCHRASVIEDVVQEALIVVYRKVGQVRSPASLAGWLVTVVHRLCMLPVLMVTRGVEELGTVDEGRQFATMSQDDLRIDLVRAIESLPLINREAIVLRDFEELTVSEISVRLAITREATKSRLHRARALIREFLAGSRES